MTNEDVDSYFINISYIVILDSPVLRTLWAAENGELEILKEMIAQDKELVHCQDCDGYTPLHRASYNGHVPVIEVQIILHHHH